MVKHIFTKINFTHVLISLIFVFVLSFSYLHQKVGIYVAGYELNKNYQSYNELVDERDYLLYNFTKEVSLPKVNQWAKQNNFLFVSPRVRLARKPVVVTASVDQKRVSSLFGRLLNIPSGMSTVLAGNRQDDSRN